MELVEAYSLPDWLHAQATPAEFQVLKKVVANTAPPGVQMLSAFGFKLPM
jgi:hypothetical protein